jgi:hypothetical protein
MLQTGYEEPRILEHAKASENSKFAWEKYPVKLGTWLY